MRSKSFETQEVREIGRKEAGESKGFPILWMGIIEDVFQMERKERQFSSLDTLLLVEMPAPSVLLFTKRVRIQVVLGKRTPSSFVVTPPLPRNRGTA